MSFSGIVISLALACIFAVLAVLAAFGPYWALRRFFAGRLSDDAQSLSSSVIVRLGALHALILALVFAQEQVNYMETRRTVTEEAAATADVYYDIQRYEEQMSPNIQLALAQYVKTVIEVEWPMLKEGKLSPLAWEYYTKVDLALLHLAPADQVDTTIRAQALDDWDKVSELRRAREMAANHHIPGFFWVVAVLGFFLVAMPYFVFEPSAPNLCALAAFAVYNGIVFYFIVSISNPFAGPAPLEPTAFERLFSESMAALLGQGSGV